MSKTTESGYLPKWRWIARRKSSAPVQTTAAEPGQDGAGAAISGSATAPDADLQARIKEAQAQPGIADLERLDAFGHASAAEQQRQRAEMHVANLLARIFRDGGQRQSEFATIDEAVEAADKLCAEYIADAEQRQRDVQQARREERERCARLLETHGYVHRNKPPFHYIEPSPIDERPDVVRITYAAAIRALEEPKP